MEVTLGQEVAVYGNGTYEVGFKVVKITKTGQITARKGNLYSIRFDKHGNQIGGSTWYGKILTTNLAKAKVEVQKQSARAAVRALGWHVSDRETLDGLEQLIKNFEEQLRLAKAEISKARTLDEEKANG